MRCHLEEFRKFGIDKGRVSSSFGHMGFGFGHTGFGFGHTGLWFWPQWASAFWFK